MYRDLQTHPDALLGVAPIAMLDGVDDGLAHRDAHTVTRVFLQANAAGKALKLVLDDV